MISECGVSFQINTVPYCLYVSQTWGLGLERHGDHTFSGSYMDIHCESSSYRDQDSLFSSQCVGYHIILEPYCY